LVKDDPVLSARSADVKTLVLAVAAILMVGVSGVAQAQHPEAANAPKFGIAVVDIAFVFKNHAQLNATMENMKNEMKSIEENLKAKRDQITKMEEARNQMNAGTPDYKKLDDQLVEVKTKFNVDMDRLRRDLMERESKLYFTTYQQVTYTIAQYAKQRNIGLVLRFNGDQPDPTKPQDILKDINKPVVFENNVDITRDILAIVNNGAAAPAPGAPAGAGTNIGTNPNVQPLK
jgi:Skp family chaperone for outer membrane proteins